MKFESGAVTYCYKVRIDLSTIVDKITDKIGHVDDYEWDVDGDTLIISAKHTTGYKHWYAKATLESPAEDELELHDCVADAVDPEVAVLNALHEVDSIRAEIEIEEGFDFGDD